jgi:serine/threonine-protein kinase
VYRAWDTRLDREVALKILPAESLSGERTSTIIHEGRLLARVHHPNVVTIHGAEQIGKRVGLWMEFVRGRTLEQHLQSGAEFTVERVLQVGIEVCRAVSAVHAAGLLHRDIKAQNVMLADDGRIVLMDLGTGREATDRDASDLTGTPLYLAPEVFDGQPASARSDIYGVGVLLYHLMTRSYPVEGRSAREVAAKQLRGERTSLTNTRGDLPPDFVRIVERALARSPDDRYESASVMQSDLTQALAAMQGSSPPADPETVRQPAWLRRGAAVVAIAAIVAGVSGWQRWWRSAPPAIAVVPFKNLSAEPGSDYFVDGLTDEIIRNLSVIDGLEVRSRTSSFFYKDKPRNIAEIGRQLAANLVVEGSVLRTGERLRINAQLVRVADDTTLWSGRFDRELKDVFAIQDEISRSIVNELRLKLGRGQRRYNTNLEVYQLYLKARAFIPRGPEEAQTATALFEQVIAKDSAFAPAYAGIAEAWATMSSNYAGVPVEEAFAHMRPAAERALQLDPLLSEAHAAMGVVLAREREWTRSEEAFRRAIQLNPNASSVYGRFALSRLFPEGRLDEALALLRTARRLDPLSPTAGHVTAYVQISAGRYEDAIKNARLVVTAYPQSGFAQINARQLLARALFHHGDRDEALSILEQLGPGSHNFRGYAYGIMGRRAEAEALAAQNAGFSSRLALIYAGLGDKDRVFQELENMAAERDPRVGTYLTYPELALIRGDPRREALRRKLGFP